MQSLALDEPRQLRLGDDLLGLRPAEPHRVLERAFEQQADEQDDDEIEKQGRHHLIDAKAHFEESRSEQSERAGED